MYQSHLEKEKFCTVFIPNTNRYNAKKKWILNSIKNKGSIIVDDGAINALTEGKSLLPVGIIEVNGKFERGDTVSIINKLNNKGINLETKLPNIFSSPKTLESLCPE